MEIFVGNEWFERDDGVAERNFPQLKTAATTRCILQIKHIVAAVFKHGLKLEFGNIISRQIYSGIFIIFAYYGGYDYDSRGNDAGGTGKAYSGVWGA